MAAMVEMEVSRVYINAGSYPRVVLKEKRGASFLQIVIGPFEAVAISMAQSRQKPLRPISYDLACSVLGEVEARIRRVEITDLHEGTFYAEIHLESADGRAVALDARPSDAIALALRAGAPIYAAPQLIEEAGYSRPTAPAREVQTGRCEGRPALAPEEKPAATEPGPAVCLRPAHLLKSLRLRLRQAVAEEAYEEAARLRDEITRLESEEEEAADSGAPSS